VTRKKKKKKKKTLKRTLKRTVAMMTSFPPWKMNKPQASCPCVTLDPELHASLILEFVVQSVIDARDSWLLMYSLFVLFSLHSNKFVGEGSNQ